MSDLWIYLAVVAVTAAVGLWWRARDGRARDVVDRFDAGEIAALGAPTGTPLLLEFVAPRCSPCRATRQVLDDVAALWPEVGVHAADVGDAVEIARHHHVLRAPTTFVLAADGTVHGRISGVPEPGEVGRLVEETVAGSGHGPRGRGGVSADISVEAPGRSRPGWALRRARARLAR